MEKEIKKPFRVVVSPSSDDERDFEHISTFPEAIVFASLNDNSATYYSFDNRGEADAFIFGYTVGCGFLGSGSYFKNYSDTDEK